jgi:ElaB/YqjD/DUF883 family membrane-anchored ribosome-binding protein
METHFEKLEEAHSLLARERVLEDLKRLSRDTEDLLKALAGDASEKGKQLKARLAAALERSKATTAEIQKRVVSSAKLAAKGTDTVIREHPYPSLGAAFGLGLLLGVLIARR